MELKISCQNKYLGSALVAGGVAVSAVLLVKGHPFIAAGASAAAMTCLVAKNRFSQTGKQEISQDPLKNCAMDLTHCPQPLPEAEESEDKRIACVTITDAEASKATPSHTEEVSEETISRWVHEKMAAVRNFLTFSREFDTLQSLEESL